MALWAIYAWNEFEIDRSIDCLTAQTGNAFEIMFSVDYSTHQKLLDLYQLGLLDIRYSATKYTLNLDLYLRLVFVVTCLA